MQRMEEMANYPFTKFETSSQLIKFKDNLRNMTFGEEKSESSVKRSARKSHLAISLHQPSAESKDGSTQ